jgi:CheY-like chemotaxis protein
MLLLSSSPSPVGEPRAGRFAACLTKPVKAAQLYAACVEALCPAAAERPAPALVADDTAVDATLGQRHPLRILLAEDNVVNQKLALIVLERLGYRADAVVDGLEVLAALARQRYDVVLMDVQMPELDGLEATRRIRAEFARADQPRIIAVTANAMQGDREMCLAAGMDDYLSKPFRPGELVTALRACRPGGGPAPGAELLDPAALANLVDMAHGDESFVGELVGLFLRDAPDLVRALRAALDAGDAPTFQRSAHTLKATSAVVGAHELSARSRELELRGAEGRLDGCAALLGRLEQELSRVRPALEALV